MRSSNLKKDKIMSKLIVLAVLALAPKLALAVPTDKPCALPGALEAAHAAVAQFTKADSEYIKLLQALKFNEASIAVCDSNQTDKLLGLPSQKISENVCGVKLSFQTKAAQLAYAGAARILGNKILINDTETSVSTCTSVDGTPVLE